MKKTISYIILLFFAGACKEKFNTRIQSPAAGYLVVEGFISSSQDPTTITLTRSVKLYDSVGVTPEHGANVNIESDNNEVFPLFETGSGIYSSANLNLNNNEKYRLHIITTDSKEYLSDFAAVRRTPDIDSISWMRENRGVRLYINTHDPQNSTKYYHWKYEETWEFHASFQSSLVYQYDQNNIPVSVVYRNANHSVDTSIYKCWNTTNSTNINLGSSEKLDKDLIYLPLVYIEPASVKLSELYSLNVRQYALSHEAFLFFQKLKKNTESLGSIFDAQPTELQGNIHCITNPGETVIGYIDISEEKQKRIFIHNTDVPSWGYSAGCISITIDNNPDSILKYGTSYFPTMPASTSFFSVLSFGATPSESCINCTFSGSNIRPSFWP